MIDQQEEDLIDATLDEAMMVTEKKEEGLPEAPASGNVKVWIRGFGTMFTVRGNKMSDVVKRVEYIVDYAESHGWKNTWDKDIQPQANKPLQGNSVPQNIKGNCPVHGTPFEYKQGTSKAGQEYAFWCCPTKNADGTFCKQKPKE